MAGNDDPSLLLALQLMQQDLEEIKSKLKGKGREGDPDDLALALEMQSLNLGSQIQCISDAAFCRRNFPQAPIAQSSAAQPAAHGLRRRFAPEPAVAGPSRQTRTPPPAAGAQKEPPSSSVDGPNKLPGEGAKALGPEAPDGPAAPEDDQNMDCVSCFALLDDQSVARAPCGHVYCPGCLAHLVQDATADESLFPPRCCKKPIPLDSVKQFLTDELILEVEAKQLEFNVVDRTYCSNTECTSFIPPKDIVADRGHCQLCETWTCTICKHASHPGLCPDDPHKAEILAIAKEEGWQQCYACNHLVELNTGCNHMTCRCKSEFCYVCGKKWKTCDCEQWDEDRLVERAELLVNRGMFGGRNNADAVGRAQRHIRRNHQCNHLNWEYRAGAARCDECRDHLSKFLFECTGCHIMACHRCRHNRL
ncbi:hypothetical protein NLG97_g2761 [Lecanicillium saksenae]|uniref:Uncharacterized protein n=1 Tax=Lecanicillium saksenae TaxID=468837 RepID=A0ACC1R030_9HYPO|nr:hypothetical protein NLG97_g2761 [Lecanicillium saksenae]